MTIPDSHFFWIRTLVGDDDRVQGRIPPDVPCHAPVSLMIALKNLEM